GYRTFGIRHNGTLSPRKSVSAGKRSFPTAAVGARTIRSEQRQSDFHLQGLLARAVTKIINIVGGRICAPVFVLPDGFQRIVITAFSAIVTGTENLAAAENCKE